jgi:hypothetical protein
MEIGKKTIAAAVGLFFLGGFSVYLLMANQQMAAQPSSTPHNSAAEQEALQQVHPSAAAQEQPAQSAPESASNASQSTEELTHEVFLAQAEARREERLINKEETDRLAKLKAAKERSVECKFWKQQQKTSSAAAKVEEKIIHYCTVQASSESTSSATNTSSAISPDASI